MENINLIRKIAWSFHMTTNIDVNDLIQEGCLAYLQALKSYHPSKGRLSTFMWWVISSHLKNYIKKYETPYPHMERFVENAIDNGVEPTFFSDDLSKEAQEIIDIIFDNIPKYSLLPPKGARLALRKETLQKKDWSWLRVRNGLHELQMVFQ